MEKLTANGVSIFRTRGELFYKENMRHLSKIEYANPLPVFLDSNCIGFAHIEEDGQYCYANMSLEYAHPMRLDLQNGTETFYSNPMVEVSKYALIQEETGQRYRCPDEVKIVKIKLEKNPDYVHKTKIGESSCLNSI